MFIATDSDDIVSHISKRKRRCRLVRSPIPADIKCNDFKIGREVRYLIHPKIVIKRVRVDHYHWQTRAEDFVIKFDPVGCAVWHSDLSRRTGCRRVTAKYYCSARGKPYASTI